MEFVYKVFTLQLTLFLLIFVGVLASKRKIINPQGRKSLSGLLINIILPCNTVSAFLGGIKADAEFGRDCLLSVTISALIQIFVTILGKYIFVKLTPQKNSVCRYGMICSNSSFIGIPVAESLFGPPGVLFTSIFQIPIRFTMWTFGLALFTKVNRKDAIKKLIFHPCIIAIFIGFALIFLPVRLPHFLSDSISILSKCTTPLSMLVIGSILSEADFKTMFSREVLFFTAIRIVIFPLLIFVILIPLHLNHLLVSISIIMSGMPAGSTASILADKYGSDAVFASQIIFVSTLFSIITIPLFGLLY